MRKLISHFTEAEQWYSGLTFSHYELPFSTRDCIPYVRSGLYQFCHSRQENSCVRAPLRSHSTSFFALHTALLASNFHARQNRKPLHWFLHKGNPTMLCQWRAHFKVNERRTSCSSNYSQYLVVDTIWDRVFHKLLGISENSALP